MLHKLKLAILPDPNMRNLSVWRRLRPRGLGRWASTVSLLLFFDQDLQLLSELEGFLGMVLLQFLLGDVVGLAYFELVFD